MIKMTQIHECKDNSDLQPLFSSHGLFLKPISRLNITIHFPELKQNPAQAAKSVSSWEIMEKLKALISPSVFISIKTVKNTIEFIRFEGDLESRAAMKTIIGRLDGKKMKVVGIKEPLRILTAEAKLSFPSKYDWDSFFRDAKNMNEMKPGERPDTLHLQNLPISWFISKNSHKHSSEKESNSEEKRLPSERLFRKIWSSFGEVRVMDIPILDPYRLKMKGSIAGIKTFTFNNNEVFEAYVQYKEYMSFVKAMDALRNMFLAKVEDDKLLVTFIKVDFDKSKHLTEESIKEREKELDKLRLAEPELGQLSHKNKSKTKTIDTISKSKSTNKIKEYERSNKETNLKSKNDDDDDEEIEVKIAMEERKYLVARRKLEAIRLMDFIFERIKAKHTLKLKRRAARQAKLAKQAAKAEKNELEEKPEMSRTETMRQKYIAARKAQSHNFASKRVKRALFESRLSSGLRVVQTTELVRGKRYYEEDDDEDDEKHVEERIIYPEEAHSSNSHNLYDDTETEVNTIDHHAYEKYYKRISGLSKDKE